MTDGQRRPDRKFHPTVSLSCSLAQRPRRRVSGKEAGKETQVMEEGMALVNWLWHVHTTGRRNLYSWALAVHNHFTESQSMHVMGREAPVCSLSRSSVA